MNRLVFIILCFLASLMAFAQREAPRSLPGDTANVQSVAPRLSRDSINRSRLATEDSTFYPPFSTFGCWDAFPLHSGMNAQLSLSTMVAFGSHSPKGAGFGRNINVIYASPLNHRFSYTLGVNSNGINWGGYQYNQTSIGGSLNYAASDRLSFTLEGSKDLVKPQSIPYFMPFNRESYLCGAVNFKFNNNIFLQFSVGTSTWNY